MRSKVSVWARGLAAVAAVGTAVVILSAGTATVNASHGTRVAHVVAGPATPAAATPDEVTWS
jgi:hypothetical protein